MKKRVVAILLALACLTSCLCACAGEKGETGAPGKDGANGIDGKDGIDGADGKDGVDGKDGTNGENGIDGKDGADGKDGVDGKDGINGADGKDGIDGKDGADGKDGVNGVTPLLRINESNNLWEVSYDGGVSWESLGVPATGEKGEQGEKGEDTSGSVIQNYQLSDGIPIDPLDDLSAFSQSKYPNQAQNASAALENTRITRSDASIELHVQAAGASVTVSKSVSMDLSAQKKVFSVWAYLPAEYKNCSLQLMLNSGEALHVTATRAYASAYTNNMASGWTLLTFYEQDFICGSAFDWSDIRFLGLVAVTPSSVSDFRILLNDLRLGMEWAPKIIFRFDDGLKGVLENAAPALLERGMSGILYCNTLFNERADNGEIDPVTGKPYSEVYCTTEDLTVLYNSGFDIGNHSRSHLVFVGDGIHYDYADTDDAASVKRTSVLYQVQNAQNWLIDRGFVRSARFFAVPGGHDTPLCQQALLDCGVLTSTNSIHQSFVPCNNVLKMPAYGINNETSLEQIKTWITDAVTRGHTVVLMFHDIQDELLDLSEGGNSEIRYQYRTADFEALLDWLVEQGWSEYAVSMSEWYEGLNRD